MSEASGRDTGVTQEMPPILLADLPRFNEIAHGFSMYTTLRDKGGMLYNLGINPCVRGFYVVAKTRELEAMNNALAGRKQGVQEEMQSKADLWITQAKAVEAAWFETVGEFKEQRPVTLKELDEYGAIYREIDREIGRVRRELLSKKNPEADLVLFIEIMDRKMRGEKMSDDDLRKLSELRTKYDLAG